MLSDARELANDQQVEADVCIIGAGPAGISIARELIGNGAQVWLLESGGRDAERRAQRLNRGQSVGYPIHRPHQSRVRAFGGTSRHWFAPGDESWAARPLDPIDFEVRPGIRYSGWPFDRTHLVPYYAQAQEVCQLGPFDYDPGRWADQERTPPLPLLPGAVETTLFQHGTADFDGYYQELVRAPNVTLVLHASVVDLATGGDPGRVDRVELRREDGSRCFVRARLVVAGRRRDRKPAPAAAQPPVPPPRARQRPRPGRAVLRRAAVGPHRVHHPGVPRADRPRRLVRRSTRPRPGYWCRERCGSATLYSGNGSSSTARSSSCPGTSP